MKYRWCRDGPIDVGTWHLVQGEFMSWGWPRDYVPKALCGLLVSKQNWTKGSEKGWDWIRQFGAGLCLRCLDRLVENHTITITWNSQGTFIVDLDVGVET